MAFSRYEKDDRIGPMIGTAQKIGAIRGAIKSGNLDFTVREVLENERLDKIANEFYGDGRYWWIIAAASNIGWWLQVPSGTRIIVPTSLEQVELI